MLIVWNDVLACGFVAERTENTWNYAPFTKQRRRADCDGPAPPTMFAAARAEFIAAPRARPNAMRDVGVSALRRASGEVPNTLIHHRLQPLPLDLVKEGRARATSVSAYPSASILGCTNSHAAP